MKMSENSAVLTFQNNCESINSNCAEVMDEIGEKITSNDITEMATNINKPEDKPITLTLDIHNVTQDDAVDAFLAGEHKNEFNDDLLLENIEGENDGIEFKSDNNIMDCPELEKNEFFTRSEEDPDDDKVETLSPENSTEDGLEVENPEENPECLTKMQIMEDVREGCNVQPSSPGHAEERLTNDQEASKSASTENPDEVKTEENGTQNLEEDSAEVKSETVFDSNHVNEESSSNTGSDESNTGKRKLENQECSNKKLRLDIQENFISRDKIINEFIEISDCGSVEQLQQQSEQLLAEIKTLNELAKEKEREWNSIIHLKKMKEELLLRMQRRKQVMMLTGDGNENGENESQSDCERLKSGQSVLKHNLVKNSKFADKNKYRNILPKPPNYTSEMNGLDYRQNKQRQVVDVQSIIADYRQRHPETVPRRGRRIRNVEGKPNNILNFSSLALGSGAQVQQNDVGAELGALLNALETNRLESRPSSSESANIHGEPSFKDMLVQFARLSQSERHELIQNAIKPPPPYPEVTVHPVPTTTTPTTSLLHGILTKTPTKANSKSSFSPTLARLLTAPERANSHSPIANSLGNSANMSISEILSTSKARNEITITPVGGQFETSTLKNKNSVDEEEAEDSADRLVIDETNEVLDRARSDNNSDTGDEVPQCQGCNQKSALFVCAGCGNQWYCSRECQVSAWDEHSEVCSG